MCQIKCQISLAKVSDKRHNWFYLTLESNLYLENNVAARNRELSPDAQGRFRPYLGWKRTGDGKYVQHRFNLGRDRENAERIMIRLRQLWQQIEATHTPNADSPRPAWDDRSLWIAGELALGKVSIFLPRKPLDKTDSYARYFHRVQNHYPFIVFVPEDQEQYEMGAKTSAERVEQRITEIETPARQQIAEIEESTKQQIDAIEQKAMMSGGLAKRLSRNGETLHKALNAYADHIRQAKIEVDEEGKQTLTAHGKYLVDSVVRFKEHHDEISLKRN